MNRKWLIKDQVKDQVKDQLIWLTAILGKIIDYTYWHTRAVGVIHKLPLLYVDY